MARNSTTGQPGKSANPAGRKPREKALTTILESAGSAKTSYNGEQIERRKALSEILWVAATSGRLIFDGRTDILSSSDYLSLVKFLYATIDPVRKELDVTSAGEPITLNIMGVIPDDDDSNTD